MAVDDGWGFSGKLEGSKFLLEVMAIWRMPGR